MKPKLKYKGKMKAGVVTPKEAVIADLKVSAKVELLEEGIYNDGMEYVIVKIFVRPKKLKL